MTQRRSTLFEAKNFTSHSGQELTWKIECEALTEWDWRGLAAIARDVLGGLRFSDIIGVPRGGTPFANALANEMEWATGGAPRLVVDDVLTTGRSILGAMTEPTDVGLVAFARGPLPPRVTALFVLGLDTLAHRSQT